MAAVLRLVPRLSQEIVGTIMDLSSRQHATGDSVWQGTGASDPEMGTFFDPTSEAFLSALAAGNLPKKRLKKFLTALSSDQRIELTALMWLGRADADLPGTPVKQAYQQCYNHARQYSGDGDVAYLMEKPLKLYLGHAMTMDIDGLVTPFSPARTTSNRS